MSMPGGVVLLALLGLGSALLCPDGGPCGEDTYCCSKPEGGYGCCPLPHKQEVEAVTCPDQESECPDDTTCCQLPDGSWGCCPMAKAVCCADKQHCCPEGTTCDLAHSQCLSPRLGSVPALQKVAARRRKSNKPSAAAVAVSAVTCPGGKSSCPDGTTCCLLTSGDYGCCPYPQAVCCSDQLHCCPSNTTCDLEHEMCQSGGAGGVSLALKLPARPNEVICPDQASSCPDETTCCQTANGTYGCCPMPDAVCCSDHIHCCPAGTNCDLTHSACASAAGETAESPATSRAPGVAAATLQTVMRRAAPPAVHLVPCNDTAACADGNTCCKSSQGDWVCCPLPKAVCCEDHLHCCPHGTVCNLAASTCDDSSGNAVLPWIDKTPVFALKPDNVKCDELLSCPGKETCCKTLSGDWACCPLEEAVCCEDHTHCCPHGMVCNLPAETCDDPTGSQPPRRWVEKMAAMGVAGHDEKCDRQTMCPSGSTCCRQSSGRWACCPLPQAVCCNDHEHCCPKGYKCNIAEQTCDKPDGLSLPWVEKTPALPRPTPLRARAPQPTRIMCDAHTSCPKDTTCCYMEKQAKWGCCPLPKAVCCADGDHCCPHGYSCNAQRSSCFRGRHIVPWSTKLSALTPLGMLGDVKCDNTSSCASGTTCCKLTTGEWGCCPLVKAVCCEDHEHCCPQTYTCNMQTGTCEKKSSDTAPMSAVVRSVQTLSSVVRVEEDVACDGTGVFRCPERETCCRSSATQWACCPSPKAVCCADSQHCCPAGSQCDPGEGVCTGAVSPAWDSFLLGRDRGRTPPGL